MHCAWMRDRGRGMMSVMTRVMLVMLVIGDQRGATKQNRNESKNRTLNYWTLVHINIMIATQKHTTRPPGFRFLLCINGCQLRNNDIMFAQFIFYFFAICAASVWICWCHDAIVNYWRKDSTRAGGRAGGMGGRGGGREGDRVPADSWRAHILQNMSFIDLEPCLSSLATFWMKTTSRKREFEGQSHQKARPTNKLQNTLMQ